MTKSDHLIGEMTTSIAAKISVSKEFSSLESPLILKISEAYEKERGEKLRLIADNIDEIAIRIQNALSYLKSQKTTNNAWDQLMEALDIIGKIT